MLPLFLPEGSKIDPQVWGKFRLGPEKPVPKKAINPHGEDFFQAHHPKPIKIPGELRDHVFTASSAGLETQEGGHENDGHLKTWLKNDPQDLIVFMNF
jgi:hypothetical protein